MNKLIVCFFMLCLAFGSALANHHGGCHGGGHGHVTKPAHFCPKTTLKIYDGIVRAIDNYNLRAANAGFSKLYRTLAPQAKSPVAKKTIVDLKKIQRFLNSPYPSHYERVKLVKKYKKVIAKNVKSITKPGCDGGCDGGGCDVGGGCDGGCDSGCDGGGCDVGGDCGCGKRL